MDLAGGQQSKVIYKNGTFYAWTGHTYTEIQDNDIAAVLAGTHAITANIGVVNTGVTAIEYGNAHQHITVLTLSQAAALTLGDNASLADGYLLYTFPAGALWVNSVYMAITIENTEHDTEACDIGIGTTIGTGAVAVLGGTAGFENILTGQTGAIGTEKVAQGMFQTSPFKLPIQAANPHIVHLNAAAAWADTAGAALNANISGVVVLDWTFLA